MLDRIAGSGVREATRVRFVYVLSPGHSGSTLVGLLLGAHPEVATVGELKVVPVSFRSGELCSCGQRMGECDFWGKVSDGVRRRGMGLGSDDFWIHPRGSRVLAHRLMASQVRGSLSETARRWILRLWPRAARERRHILACNIALIQTIMDETGRRIFLDTSKDASRLRYLIESGVFDLRVLHLIRDGRAVAYSLVRKGVAASVAAREWVDDHIQAERLRPRVPSEHWMTLRYEDLCADADGTMVRVCEFVGASPDRRTLDFRSWDNHVLGNRMRLTSARGISLDTSWRDAMSERDRAIVEPITRELNHRFGYV